VIVERASVEGGGDALRLAVLAFAVDRVTAEVTVALAAAGVPSVVLKGPGIAGWLYAGDGSRLYGDTDLLVRAADWERAMEVLAGIGFADALGALAHPRMESGSGYPWTRPSDGAEVDLHRSLFGIGAGPDQVWEAFSEGAERKPIGGAEVALPPHPARLLHIALHAVQHAGEVPKAMIDLERAIERALREEWVEARQLAERLDAAPTFAAGLSLTPSGRELAATIDAVAAGPARAAALRLERVPLAEGFEELADAPGARAKLALLARELFPNPAFMRWWSPLACRGRGGLVAAYAWRPLWLAWRAVPGYRAWRRARRRDRP
jgi:hypothetical protein